MRTQESAVERAGREAGAHQAEGAATTIVEKRQEAPADRMRREAKEAAGKLPYSVDAIRRLEEIATAAGPLRPVRRMRFDPGGVIEADVTGVAPASPGWARLKILKFAGGGFAGQVYQVELEDVIFEGEPIAGLEPGRIYALKILVPPSRFSRMFRNVIYWLAYQGPFSAQVSPAASRAGVLWQKLIRRGAHVRLGREDAVADTYATLWVPELSSYAEINEWVPGRTWKYEIDDRVFDRKKCNPSDPGDFLEATASREYMGKRVFMRRLVDLFHDMGAPELARQYEWWTAKSQPNALKRFDTGDGPVEGLCAIDFRAGLALLPFLPMSPGDFRLMHDGFQRGNAVQFDRGDLKKLEAFIDAHAQEFADLRPALEELKAAEDAYRSSLPDITHHGIRVFFDDDLRPRIASGLVQGYKAADLVDEAHADRLRRSSLAFTLFYLVGVIPLLGRFLRKLWGNARHRAHLGMMLKSWTYAKAAFRARIAETAAGWYRKGRAGEQRALALPDHPVLFWLQRLTIGFLPASWHRAIAEPSHLWQNIKSAWRSSWSFITVPQFREEWLSGHIRAARADGMISEAEEERALESAKDPFVAKYLLCLGAHILTIPITQIVTLILGSWAAAQYGDSPEESVAIFAFVAFLLQVTPISPGSIMRGLIVVGVMIWERNWRDYRVPAMISFVKYIGYFAFPIQMVYRFPVLARLMAGRCASSMVRIVPVFGEKGALAEHWLFDIFFNVPVSLRRRARERKERSAARA